MRLGLLAVAGAAGALARYGIGQAVGPRSFPWATFAINVTGALALGFVLAGPIAARWPADITTAITVGFLGAFTTFSTFAYEATALLRDDRPVAAFTYVASSLVVGLVASALGYVLGRAVT
ncbi:MAG TPA: fluoride efflux transporter CrcB [Ilumatobacteraceae bacterium]|nr:fluoride efflux transporter CrcB [Ilumatobacteraceae bacterium]